MKTKFLILEPIAEEYGLRIVRIKEGDKYCQANGTDAYINHSYICHPEIHLGIYEDDELELISFFHELGHVLDKTDWTIGSDEYTKLDSERMAWTLGFWAARKYGFEITEKMRKWADKQISTYDPKIRARAEEIRKMELEAKELLEKFNKRRV